MLLKCAPEPGRAVIVERFIGVARGYCGDEMRIHHAAFHLVQAPVAEVITQPVGVQKKVGPAQLGGPEQLLVTGALMAEVVDGIADLLAWHRPAVLLAQQHWNQARLPVVAMNDIWSLTRGEQELDRRL